MTVRWQSQPGHTYYLHITETLTDLSGPATWTVEGDGTTNLIQVPKNGRKALFCRLSVQLPRRQPRGQSKLGQRRRSLLL